MKQLKAKEWTDEEVRVLTTMVRQKSTASAIASALGRHTAYVERMANEFCLPLAKKQTSVIASRPTTSGLSRSDMGEPAVAETETGSTERPVTLQLYAQERTLARALDRSALCQYRK